MGGFSVPIVKFHSKHSKPRDTYNTVNLNAKYSASPLIFLVFGVIVWIVSVR